MDRRRWLLLVFVVALVVASFDVYSNGWRILDQWVDKFEVWVDEAARPDPSLLPHVVTSYTATQTAKGVNTFVLENSFDNVTIQGAETDEVTIHVEVRGRTPGEDGDTDAGGSANAPPAVRYELLPDGVLQATLNPNTVLRRGEARIGYAQTTITIPAHLAVRLRAANAVVNLHGIRGPLRVRGAGMGLNIEPAGAAPIKVTMAGGQVTLSVPRHVADYNFEATLSPGTIKVAGIGIEEQTDGMRTVATATVGEGTHPIQFEVAGGHVEFSVVD